jgi:hypothetical protein
MDNLTGKHCKIARNPAAADQNSEKRPAACPGERSLGRRCQNIWFYFGTLLHAPSKQALTACDGSKPGRCSGREFQGRSVFSDFSEEKGGLEIEVCQS